MEGKGAAGGALAGVGGVEIPLSPPPSLPDFFLARELGMGSAKPAAVSADRAETNTLLTPAFTSRKKNVSANIAAVAQQQRRRGAGGGDGGWGGGKGEKNEKGMPLVLW